MIADKLSLLKRVCINNGNPGEVTMGTEYLFKLANAIRIFPNSQEVRNWLKILRRLQEKNIQRPKLEN
jgi:hypothetical protein